jgi:hypothetical protein
MSNECPTREEMSARRVADVRELILGFDYEGATHEERLAFFAELIAGLEKARRLIEANESR